MSLGDDTFKRVTAGVLTGGFSELGRLPGGDILSPLGSTVNELTGAASGAPKFTPPTSFTIPEAEDFSKKTRITGSGGAGSVGPGAASKLRSTIKRNKRLREQQEGSTRPSRGSIGGTGLQI